MQNVKLPVETVNKVLNFLASMPYSQVSELINEVQRNAEIIEPTQTVEEPVVEEKKTTADSK
jgi:hypothetical protein